MTLVTGRLFHYTPWQTAFEYGVDKKPKNVVVFIGGLGDGFGSLPYLPELAERVPASWGVILPQLRSSYTGWTRSSLATDLKDLKNLVTHLRNDGRERIVLGGHSTGCQDVMYYLLHAGEDPLVQVDGGIMQGGVSDIEAMASNQADLESLQDLVAEVESEFGPDLSEKEFLDSRYTKIAFGNPISAARFVSIAKIRGNEDYFSSYLTPEDHALTFGRLKRPLLVLYGGQDEFVPKSVDKAKVFGRFKDATPIEFWSQYSHIVAGASHKVGDKLLSPGAQEELVESIVRFLETL